MWSTRESNASMSACTLYSQLKRMGQPENGVSIPTKESNALHTIPRKSKLNITFRWMENAK